MLAPLLKRFPRSRRVQLQDLASLVGVQVQVRAADGEDRVHQTFVLVRQVQQDIFKGVASVALDCERSEEHTSELQSHS